MIAHAADGVTFTPVAEVSKEQFGAESLERPALVRTPEGRWRLYVSAATPGTKHWRVDLLEADTVEGLPDATARTVLAGDETVGVKDPVLHHDEAGWHLWASVHPLESWDDADRMTTEYATSPDGVTWTWRGTALAGRAGSGTRAACGCRRCRSTGTRSPSPTTAGPPPRRTGRSAPGSPAGSGSRTAASGR
ncbi:hypothetical protein [Paractinoplanes durhamensis]|uniref:hypothetical protein n=1 Tax=Paractinoplanes durhamensis TaxID=113563 RepID=UPI0036409260